MAKETYSYGKRGLLTLAYLSGVLRLKMSGKNVWSCKFFPTPCLGFRKYKFFIYIYVFKKTKKGGGKGFVCISPCVCVCVSVSVSVSVCVHVS